MSYIFSKKAFIIFQETELFYILGKGTLLYFKKRKSEKSYYISSSQNEKNPQLIHNFISGKWNFQAPSLKNFLYFKRELAKPENFTFLFVVRELFQNKCKRKRFFILLFVSAKFSKLKYFLVIIMNRLFSFYNISFYIQQAFAFHFLRDFCNVSNHIFIYTKKNHQKMNLLEDLKILLLNFNCVMISITNKMFVSLKNHLNYLKDSIFECFFRENNRHFFNNFFTTYNDEKFKLWRRKIN